MKVRSLVIASIAGTLAIVLAVWSGRERAEIERRRQENSAPASFSERLLGPIATLAANVQWVRVDEALRLGRPELAYARAETALTLAPGDAEGWIFLAHHFIYDRAALLREPDRAARARWIELGLDVLARGEKLARRPGRVALKRGSVFLSLAGLNDDERAWPGTRREAWLEAAVAFDFAAAHDEPMAAEAAAAARAAADAAPR